MEHPCKKFFSKGLVVKIREEKEGRLGGGCETQEKIQRG